LFEYLGASRPIFYLGDFGSDVSRILDETEAGTLFDRKRAEHFLYLLQEQIQKGPRREDAVQQVELLSDYFRSNQATAFLDVIRGVAHS
jgi:hypothetical protein